ncbi:sigma-70 family RNA polymerase sigma factor [Aquimarina sp. MMG016]|uniref:RNA polymerase sigma factor n=1 Tax=Aquimarina sp. MMG016 TaxID=2822690 RepID=UPI001B3A4D57|nr:sigma-70 family RNA polymerase sigma factor [Aquimarina sp. MMG016]MBQ4819218.1 sigma-70 family RNA polymerase sigma factor [Aquimarina sp. MMG016]
MQKDQKIINGIKTGNERILKAFYKKNFLSIKMYIIKNSGNKEDAEDVFQDALVVIYQKLRSDSLILNCSINTYFYGVCKNLWRNRLRTKKKAITTNTFIEYHDTNTCIILDEIEIKEREHLYRKHFLKLSSSSKEILHLFFEGKSMREISKITGYSEGYARKKKFEAKKAILTMVCRDSIYKELNTVYKKKENTSLIAV